MKTTNEEHSRYFDIFEKKDIYLPVCFYLLHTDNQKEYASKIAEHFDELDIDWYEKTGTKTSSLTSGGYLSRHIIKEELKEWNIVYFKGKGNGGVDYYQLSPEILFSSRNLSVGYEDCFKEIFGCELDAKSVWWLYFIPSTWFDDTDMSTPRPYDLSMSPPIFIPRVSKPPKSGHQIIAEDVEMSGEEMEELGEEIIEKLRDEGQVRVSKSPSDSITPPPPPPSYLHTIIFRTIPEMFTDEKDVIEWLSELQKFDYFTLLFYYLQILALMNFKVMGEKIEEKEFPDILEGYSYPPISISKEELQKELQNQVEKIWEKMDDIEDKKTKKSMKINLNHHLKKWSSEDRWVKIRQEFIDPSSPEASSYPSLESAKECFEGEKGENLLKNTYEQTKDFVLWQTQNHWMGRGEEDEEGNEEDTDEKSD